MNFSPASHAGTALLCACWFLVACAHRLDGYAAPAPGSSFVFERRDSGSFGVGTSEGSNEVLEFFLHGQAMVAFDSPGALLVYGRDGSLVGLAARDGSMVATWNPPVAFPFPLEVGKRWKQKGHIHMHVQDRKLPFETESVVEAVEDLELPAGRFSAWRIRSLDDEGNVSVEWLCPQLGIYVKRSVERTSMHPQGPGRSEFLLKSHRIRMP
ncbi:MAG TPA: hypothetical protein VGD76_16555 [Ramlibacter sp.]